MIARIFKKSIIKEIPKSKYPSKVNFINLSSYSNYIQALVDVIANHRLDVVCNFFKLSFRLSYYNLVYYGFHYDIFKHVYDVF